MAHKNGRKHPKLKATRAKSARTSHNSAHPKPVRRKRRSR